MVDPTVVQQLKDFRQEHVLKFYDELSEQERSQLLQDIRETKWAELDRIYKDQVIPQLQDGKLKPTLKIDDELLQPLPENIIGGTTRCNATQLDNYREVGLKSIAQGKVAALLLAGGQGTRLGVDYPKGMFDVGLPSHKTLFQLQAERLMKLNESATGGSIFWYIMTSEATMVKTMDFFKANNYFGLNADNIIFFEQSAIQCFSLDGRVLLDEKHRLAKSPNGNGGLYESLHQKGIIKHMQSNGIEYVHVYCVDNILVRVCDPIFMGYNIEKGVDVGAKVVEKLVPTEAVGTICKVGDQFKVIEYSEISEQVAERRNEASGKLSFHAGNICEHFFRVDFLASINSDNNNKSLRYHLALKKIPHVSLDTGERQKPTEPNGIKLEKFIFDVFEFTDKFAAWEVRREDEFSPLKNADGSEKDNPTTAREALLRAQRLGILD